MVQWFKKIFKKKHEHYRLVEFNREKLQSDISGLGTALYEYRNEVSLKIMLELIDVYKNVFILDTQRCLNEKELLVNRGGLQALTGLQSFIDKSLISVKEEKVTGKVKRIHNSIKTTGGTGTYAGSAI